MKPFIFFTCLSFAFFSLCYAENEETELPCTGTLLSFYSQNVLPGHILIEPIIFMTSNYGLYDANWSLRNIKNIYELELLFVLETGLTKSMDITLVLDGLRSWVGRKKSLELSDTQLYLGFQISEDQKGTMIPDFRILVGESFPTGKHDNLDEQKLFADGVGSGAYETIIVAVLQKKFYSLLPNPFFINLNFLWFFPAKTNVKEFNVYGGGLGTNGTVKPGREYIFNLGFEYMLSQHWEATLDLRYEHQNTSKFFGDPGTDRNGNINPVGLPSSEQFSTAQSLQYRHNDNCTIASGIWYSFAGRNSDAFVSFVIRAAFYF